MVRTALMFTVALAGVTLVISPDSNWVPAPVAAPVEPVAVAESVAEPNGGDIAPSFIVPPKRVAFPTIPATSVAAVETPVPTPVLDEDIRIVTAQALNVRDRPSSSSNVMGKLVAGEEVTVIGEERSWLEVVTPDGRSGWISGKFVKTPS